MSESAGPLLLVEDSETQALQMRHMLEGHGFPVHRVATAELALEALNGPLPALVIADYHLPGINGDELVRQIRLNSRTRAIPVLMLTEAREGDLERQGLESGADAYVAKSAAPEMLLPRIRALLRQRTASAAPETAAAPFRRARLLVLHESPTYRSYLTGLLERSGHEVTPFARPEAALAAVAEQRDRWDGVVFGMPQEGGEAADLCRRLGALRDPGAGAGFQIITLGAEDPAGHEAMARTYEAGADDIIPASADAKVLVLRINAALRRKMLQEEDRRAAEESRARLTAVERARAEAAAAQAKAALAEALERANRELRDTQTKLVQAAKMASLGELVAGIAHEINNPLAFILAHQGTVERLLGQIEATMPETAEGRPQLLRCRERVGAMALGLRRIQEVVVNLRKFSRQEDAFRVVNVPDALDTVLALLAHKLGDRVIVQRHYTAVPELCCSPALLNQVVMNIISNATDAMPEGGTIAITTRNDMRDYQIEITDTGPGVPQAMRDRIFEPFFTTKAVGQGTGLGLAIAYNVIQAHGGTILVDDGDSGGARFLISVPREPDTAAEHA